MIELNCRCLGASGSVFAKTVVNAAREAPEVNHLCPLITHWSPSRTAVAFICVGALPAPPAPVYPPWLPVAPRVRMLQRGRAPPHLRPGRPSGGRARARHERPEEPLALL